MINKSVAFQNCLFRSSVGVDKTSTALGKSEIIQFADLWCPHNDLGWFWYILERFSWDNPEFWSWESTSFTKSEPLLPSLAEAQGLSFFEFGLESFFKRIFRVPTFWEKLLREARTVQNIRILKTDFFFALNFRRVVPRFKERERLLTLRILCGSFWILQVG